MGLTATKFGCGLGQCGACKVLIEGKARRPARRPLPPLQASRSPRSRVSASPAALHPVQAAFIREQVPQCGYCASGMIISAAALLREKPKPTEADVRSALDGNLCRCGTHTRVLRAVMLASGQGG